VHLLQQGKFCENGAKTRTEYLHQQFKFVKLMVDPLLTIQTIEILNDDVIMVQYSEKKERQQALAHESQITGIMFKTTIFSSFPTINTVINFRHIYYIPG